MAPFTEGIVLVRSMMVGEEGLEEEEEAEAEESIPLRCLIVTFYETAFD